MNRLSRVDANAVSDATSSIHAPTFAMTTVTHGRAEIFAKYLSLPLTSIFCRIRPSFEKDPTYPSLHDGRKSRDIFGEVFPNSRRSCLIRLTHDSETSNRIATSRQNTLGYITSTSLLVPNVFSSPEWRYSYGATLYDRRKPFDVSSSMTASAHSSTDCSPVFSTRSGDSGTS